MDDFFYDRYDRLVRPVRDGRNLTELYTFISPNERNRFPDGELIIVRYDPISRPDRGENVRLRRFLYRAPTGDIRSITWDEERFQAMLAETGITIPPPQPLPPEPPLPVEIQPQQQPQPEPEASDMESVEEQPAHPDAAPLPEPSADQPQEPAPEEETEDDGNRILLWLSGGLLALLLLATAWRLIKRRGASA